MTPARDESDEVLMQRVQGDDTRAFGRLYDRHVERGLLVARSVCRDGARAEDAVQEGFLSIWRTRASFRPERGSFQGWAMTIVQNRALDGVRREAAGRRPPAANGETAVPDATAVSAHDTVVARGESDALRATLGLLPGAQARVITLAYFGGLSQTEIASHLELPVGTVKGRMRLGLEKLRRTMEASG